MWNVVIKAVCLKFAIDGVGILFVSVLIKAAALSHKAIHNSMEGKSVIKAFICQLYKVCNGFRCFITIKLNVYSSIALDFQGGVVCNSKVRYAIVCLNILNKGNNAPNNKRQSYYCSHSDKGGDKDFVYPLRLFPSFLLKALLLGFFSYIVIILCHNFLLKKKGLLPKK